jgi:putative ABC transport system permease protein
MYFFTFILKNLLRRPTRTALTVLGLAVAVGSMIALLGISNNFRSSLRDTFEKRGVDLIVIQANLVIQTDSMIPETVVETVRQMPEVTGVDAAVIGFPLVERAESGTAITGVVVLGWGSENFAYDDLKVVAGRKLTVADAGKRRCMLGKSLADNINQGVGGAILIERERFEVVGIFDSFNYQENAAVLAPLLDTQEVFPRKGTVTAFSLRVRHSSANHDEDVERVREKILALTDSDGKPYRLDVKRPKEYLDEASHLQMSESMAWAVSLIALVIGIISMLNTMAMSVLERTQEIGILRAVGWPRRRILMMVLGEAVVLSAMAAAAGTIGALAATYLLSFSTRAGGFVEGGIAAWVILQGFGITLLIGLLGGAFPALRASRLLPTEAIRHD